MKVNHTVKLSSDKLPVTTCGNVFVNNQNRVIRCKNGWLAHGDNLFSRKSLQCDVCNDGKYIPDNWRIL